MKALACKDLGIKCDYVAKGDTTKEVIGNVAEHIKNNHPESRTKVEDLSDSKIEKELLPLIKEIS